MRELTTSINRLSLSLRTSALLREAGVRTLEDLRNLPAAAMKGPLWTPAVRAEVWAWLSPTAALELQLDDARGEIARLQGLLNSPELLDFAGGVAREAAHQRERYGVDHDAGKGPEDWFWLLGYLAGKALRAAIAGDVDKALHHCISSAAALANWHAALSGADNRMRPGIEPPAGEGQS